MITINSSKGLKDIDKVVLGLLFPTDNEHRDPTLSRFRDAFSLGRTSKIGYEVWSEWVVEVLSSGTVRRNYPSWSEEKPVSPIFCRYLDFCCTWEHYSNPEVWMMNIMENFASGTLQLRILTDDEMFWFFHFCKVHLPLRLLNGIVDEYCETIDDALPLRCILERDSFLDLRKRAERIAFWRKVEVALGGILGVGFVGLLVYSRWRSNNLN